MMASGVPAGAKTPCQELPVAPPGSRSARTSVRVGRSGSAGMRSDPEVASALILPALMLGIAVVDASSCRSTTPAIRSTVGTPLYGTCVILRPRPPAIVSIPTCGCDPTPLEA